ncbi:MAG TPA: PEP-CTERM sorting domain-containing protein, partial [Myxococcota bacterium]|nr:PEP-CTERM sorting domain-containing protein [Myxococcota bacterium]
NSQTGGGLANATAYTAQLSDPGTANNVFGTANYAGSSNGGGGGPSYSPFNTTSPDPTATLTAAYQGNVGEINAYAGVPTDFRLWSDSVAPYANGGAFPVGSFITQTYSDVIRVSFRLRAESRPSGSVSTTGGEALACAGQTSPLGGFNLDDGGGNCGSGFSLTASLLQTGTYNFMVPEPATAALLGGSVLGLVWMVRRSRQG